MPNLGPVVQRTGDVCSDFIKHSTFICSTTKHEAMTDRAGLSPVELETAVHALTDVVIGVDETGRVRRVSDPDSTLEVERVLGRPVGELIAADAASGYEFVDGETFQSAVMDGSLAEAVVPFRGADGTVVPLAVTTTNGDTTYKLCLCRDTPEPNGRSETDRRDTPEPNGRPPDRDADQSGDPTTKAAERSIEAVPDPLCVLDGDRRIETVNAAMVSYTGYNRRELVGRNVSELLLADGEPFDVEPGSHRVETTVVTKDGQRILTEVHVRADTDSLVGVFRDIRERKRREMDLDRLKRVFSRVFRHNVRNELTVIRERTKLLAANVDDPAGHAEYVLESAAALQSHSEKARLIDEIVETEHRQPVDLTAVVRDRVEAIREQYPAATITLDAAHDVRVEAHPQLGRAIEELLDNAIVHAPTDEPRVRVWFDEETDVPAVYVEDESGGLSEYEIDVLRSGTETDLHHGSGVGLWLVRWLVERSNAEMIVHRTEAGTLMGLRFAGESPVATGRSPVAAAPAHVRDAAPDAFDGGVFVERTNAHRQLETTYETLDQTGGRSVVITGEAGVGKTTLLEWFREYLTDRPESPHITRGTCQAATQEPYRAFHELLADLPTDRALTELVEDAGSMAVSDADELTQTKRALFADVADVLREAAADRPVVLLIEDLQWADRGTIDLFEYLIDEVGKWSYPVLFVGTYRIETVGETHPVLEIAEETAAAGRGQLLDLQPFDRDDVASLVTHRLGVDDAPSSFVTAVAEHTGGNPLFVDELGQRLSEELGPVATSEDLPDTLADVSVPATIDRAITDKLAALPAEVRPVLRLGAVAGTSFSFDLVRAASEKPPAAVIDDIETLTRRRVWTQSADGLSFVHGVVREQALDRIDSADCSRLHARIASAIEAIHDPSEHAGRLANHWAAAGEPATAAEYALTAGRNAADAYAHEDAIDYYEQALADATDRETLATVTGELGDVYELLGQYEPARTQYEQSLQYSRAVGDTAGEAASLHDLGEIARHRDEYDRAETYYTDSIDRSRAANDREGEAKSLTQLGVIAYYRGNHETAEDRWTRSLELARACESQQYEAESLNNLGVVSYYRGDYERAHEYYSDSLAIKQSIGHRRGVATTYGNLGSVARERGEYEQAREYYTNGLEIQREIGHVRGEGLMLNSLGRAWLRCGNYDRARRCFENSLTVLEDTHAKRREARSYINLGLVDSDRGEYESAVASLEDGLAITREIGYKEGQTRCLTTLGRIARRQGDHERANDRLTTALERARELGVRRQEMAILTELGALARQRGDDEQAAERFEQSLSINTDEASVKETVETHLQRVRLALDRGALAAARDALTQARETITESDHFQARATALDGRIAAAAGTTDAARERLATALEAFETIGAFEDAVDSLQRLAELDATDWEEHARRLHETAPDEVLARHREWFETHGFVGDDAAGGGSEATDGEL